MRIIRTLLRFVLTAAFLGGCILFTWQNSQSVAVKFGRWAAPESPLALVLVVAFVAGVLASGFYFLIEVIRTRAELRKARKMCELLEKEADALRNLPLFDEPPAAGTAAPNAFDQHLTHEGQPESSIGMFEPKRTR